MRSVAQTTSWRAVAGAVLLGALLALTFAPAADAGTVAGVIPDLPTGWHLPSASIARAPRLSYGGGPVLHANRTHVIFWEPAGSGMSFEPGYEQLIERFLAQVAVDSHKPTNVYGLTGQYHDAAGPAVYDSKYAGAVVATDPLPASQCSEPSTGPPGWTACLTDSQLEQEIDSVVSAGAVQAGPTDVYFLVLPDTLAACTDSSSSSCALGGSDTGYCGYHSQTSGGVFYAVIPYNAVPGHCQSGNPRPNRSTADPAIFTISHEHNEVITDPLGYGSWIDVNGNEDGDLCITSLGPPLGGSGPLQWNEVIGGGHYYLQEEWSNEDGSCRPRDESDPVSFKSPARIATGRSARLTGRAGDPDGRIVSYSWSFGDGTSAVGRVVSHAFRRAGSYRVTLRTTDSAGNWAFASRLVRALGPAVPRYR